MKRKIEILGHTTRVARFARHNFILKKLIYKVYLKSIQWSIIKKTNDAIESCS